MVAEGQYPAPIVTFQFFSRGRIRLGFLYAVPMGLMTLCELAWQVGPEQAKWSAQGENESASGLVVEYQELATKKFNSAIYPVICLCREETWIASGADIFMSQNNYLIDKRVILDCERMTLSCAGESITISESERSLLIAFHEGLFKKMI